MRFGMLVNRVLAPFKLQLINTRRPEASVYDQDGLRTAHNHEFREDPAFQRAYRRGIQAVGRDYNWHWRVHVGLWAAAHADLLGGDFVECGVNRGFLSSAIMDYLDWNRLDKTFYLLDTFRGLDERFISDEERRDGILERTEQHLRTDFYTTVADPVKANFSEWKNVRFVEGAIPETLDRVDSDRIAYLHLDLNCSPPEVAAAEFFWDRLVPGAVVLLDDYAYKGYRSQKLGMDAFARARGVSILSLPTGQGLLLKPS
jgi:hypothetical protein